MGEDAKIRKDAGPATQTTKFSKALGYFAYCSPLELLRPAPPKAGYPPDVEMTNERKRIEAAIGVLEARRSVLGDAIVDTAIGPLRMKLAELAGSTSEAAPTQYLKLTSILVLDIVGSTTLAQLLDPEETSNVIDGALAQFTAIVLKHGGKVLQYAGDSLLAVFGADEVRENDAERAIRAGLELLQAARERAALVSRRHGYDGFNVRVGVHTGEALLGAGVDPGGSIRGHAVNIAARMEQMAPAGALRITADTYRQVSGIFSVQSQPPLAVKGLSGPLRTYLVTGENPRTTRVGRRAIEDTKARFIGRKAELGQLQSVFRQMCNARRLATVTIAGEAGVGKSRLLHEFNLWLNSQAPRVRTLEARADPHTREQAYGLVRGLLAWYLRIANNESMESAKARLTAQLVPLLAATDGTGMAEAHAHVLGQLIGLDFTSSPHVRGIADDVIQIRNRGFHVVAQLFRRLAERDGTPIVVYIDDLHWADDGSLDLLDYVVEVNGDVPMLILAATRARGLDRPIKLESTGHVHERIDLAPLDRQRCRELCDELLKDLPEAPAHLRELISERADGNPFYIEELVAMLIDRGAIESERGPRARRSEGAGSMEVPATLAGVLQARLDELAPAERAALQVASVVGVVFWDAALDALSEHGSEVLPELRRRGLVVCHEASLMDGMREYAFRHQILQQVTYDTVLKARRRELHAKAAAWLNSLSGVRANDFLGTLAEHYARAGDDESACQMFTRAAEHAAARYAHADAIKFAARAFDVMGDRSDQQSALLRWRLLDVRERMLDLQGRRNEQQSDIDDLERLANIFDDDGRRAEAAWRRSGIALRTGQFRAMEGAARTAVALASRASDSVLKLRAHHRLACALCMLGEVDRGKSLASDGLASARAQDSRLMEAHFLNALCFVAWRQQDLLTGLGLAQQELAIDRELGDRVAEADTLINVGDCYANLGANSEAASYLDQGLRLARAVGSRAKEPYALCGLCLLALRRNDNEQALASANAALNIAISVQDRRAEMNAQYFLGDAELASQRYEAAAQAFEAARALAAVVGEAQAAYEAKAGLARVALARADSRGALSFAEDLLSYLAWGGHLIGLEAHAVRMTCYEALAHSEDPRAGEVLAAAHAALQTVAATISDADLRRSYLDNIPEHRAIAAAWATSRGTGRAVAS